MTSSLGTILTDQVRRLDHLYLAAQAAQDRYWMEPTETNRRRWRRRVRLYEQTCLAGQWMLDMHDASAGDAAEGRMGE